MKCIAFITDIHLDEGLLEEHKVDCPKNWQLILKDVTARGIGAIVFGGDIGAASAYPWFFETLGKFDYKFILGNHDSAKDAIPFYKGSNAGVGELYYAASDTHRKYIFLDTSSERVSDAQFNWLKDELVSDKDVVIFIHHPVLAVDSVIDNIYPLHGRERVADVLQTIDNQITIFCGHYHMPDVQQVGNIKQYITPAASYQIVKEAAEITPDNSTFGYRIISFDEEEIKTELVMYNAGEFVTSGLV